MTGRLLTGREVAELYRVQPETVRRWHRAGKIRSVRTPGGAIRFPEDALEVGRRPDEGVSATPLSAARALRYLPSATPEDEE